MSVVKDISFIEDIVSVSVTEDMTADGGTSLQGMAHFRDSPARSRVRLRCRPSQPNLKA